MKGLYIINSLEGGGAEHVFSQLVFFLANDEKLVHNIEVIILDSKEEKYKIPDNICVYRITEKNNFFKLIKFFKLLMIIRPTYALSFLTRANNFNILGGLLFSYKSILSERSNTSGRLGKGIQGWLKHVIVKTIYSQAKSIIAVSSGVEKCLIKDFNISKNKLHVLYNPIDSIKINKNVLSVNKTSNEQPIIAMGRLVKTKGFEILLKAYALADIDCKLQILGQGPEHDNLYVLANKLGISDKVEFLGFKDNPYDYINNALFFVLPSRLEGFPNSLLEAMALGKAIISTDCTDGPREILVPVTKLSRNTYTKATFGVMINVDDIEALKQSMHLMYKDVELKNYYELQSIKRIKDFDGITFYTNYLNILENILNENIYHEKDTL